MDEWYVAMADPNDLARRAAEMVGTVRWKPLLGPFSNRSDAERRVCEVLRYLREYYVGVAPHLMHMELAAVESADYNGPGMLNLRCEIGPSDPLPHPPPHSRPYPEPVAPPRRKRHKAPSPVEQIVAGRYHG